MLIVVFQLSFSARTNFINIIYRKRQKFRGWKVLRFAGFIRYFRDFSITTFMVFQLYKTATTVSTKALCSSHEFFLKLSLAYSEMDESTLLTRVCADSCFPRWLGCSHRRRATVEVSPRLLTTSLLVSSASYFLISWQKDSSPLLRNISRGVNFQRSKSLTRKTFAVY